MAKDHPEAPRKKTVFCFTVACFNFADDATPDSKPQQGQPDATNNRNLRRWLCWSRRLKLQKSVAKTVPVDGSPDAASTTTVVRSKTKKFSLIGSKGRHLEAERPSERRGSKAEEASEVCDGNRRVQETPTEAVHQNLSVETHVDPTESDLGNTYPPWNLRTVGKLDADRAVAVASTAAQPVSPDQIRPTSAVRYSAVISPSSSSPLRLITQKPILKTDVGKKLDPVVGISVIMVTLVIMIMWGRLCAILCASVCLYFIPKFRSSEGSGGPREEGGLDMESEEYKKKVVLEGLLERNRRS